MATATSFRDLIVWQRARDLAVEAYRLSASLPDSERFGLMSQIRRAAASILANIAEGQGRATRGEFRQFLGVARGSLRELETHFLLAERLGLLPDVQGALELCDQVGKLLWGLERSLTETRAH